MSASSPGGESGSGRFTAAELRQPLLDRWTPVRLVLHPLLAVGFWALLLPALVIAHVCMRCATAVLSLCSSSPSPSSGSPPQLALPPSDAVWLHDTAHNQNVITAVLILRGRVSLSSLRAVVSSRLVQAPGLEKLSHRINAQQTAWIKDEAFDIAQHVVCWPYWRGGSTQEGEEMAEAASWSEEGSSRALQSLIGSVINTPIARAQVWSFTLLPGYADGCVVVFRAHHVLADGVLLSGVLLETLMDPLPPAAQPETPHAAEAAAISHTPLLAAPSSPAASSPRASPAQAPRPAGFSLRVLRRIRRSLSFLVSLLLTLLLGPLYLVSLSMRRDDHNPLHHSRCTSRHKSVAWSFHPISMQRVKRVSRHYGCSVNDVMMAVLVAALQRVVERKGMTASPASPYRQREMHFLVPINIRPLLQSPHAPLSLGNLFAVLIQPFPLYCASPRSRLLAMTRQMSLVKRSVQPLLMFVCLHLTVSLLPASLSHALLDLYNDMCTAVLTNNRSPERRLFLLGCRLEQWVSWAPCRSGVACSMTVLSYAGSMLVSVVMDRAVGVPGEELVRRYEHEFSRLEDTLPADFMPLDDHASQPV